MIRGDIVDSTRIGNFIREIRKKEKLSQQKFAEKYGVTYQAVSKWENGKNIPDLSILKQMCQEYHINLDDFLETKISKKPKLKLWIFMFLTFICIILVIVMFLKKDHSFELKGLSATCDNFNIYGSIAYNRNKTSIYISNIIYCGETNHTKYKRIDCTLYELSHKTQTEISKYQSKEDVSITLEEFLKNVKFNVDHYEKTCKIYKDNTLYLEIEAIDNAEKITTYKIPLRLEEDCKISYK